MKAIAVENFGDEPRLMKLADPEPGPGEILVAIEAASINPADWQAAEGAYRGVMEHEFPLVLGFDGAGRVEAVGAGAGRFAVGDLVHGQFSGDTIGRGTFAERVAIAERPSNGALELVPEGLPPGLAAAVPIAGITADGALAKTGCRSGQTLLILGATGRVGVLATQLAARAGITVIATARGWAGTWSRASARPRRSTTPRAQPRRRSPALTLTALTRCSTLPGTRNRSPAPRSTSATAERSSRPPRASPMSSPARTASPRPTAGLTTSRPGSSA